MADVDVVDVVVGEGEGGEATTTTKKKKKKNPQTTCY